MALPWFDGERTPNLPDAQAAILGLRHDTPPGAILGATYEGAVVWLLEALVPISHCSDPLDPAAPIVLIGGGARGQAWQESVPSAFRTAGAGLHRRRPGRPRGAAQAAGALLGVGPIAVQDDWQPPDRSSWKRCPSTKPSSPRYRTVRDAVMDTVGTLRR